MTKNKAKVYVEDEANKITFDDVAGVEEAKEDDDDYIALVVCLTLGSFFILIIIIVVIIYCCCLKKKSSTKQAVTPVQSQTLLSGTSHNTLSYVTYLYAQCVRICPIC